MLNDLCTIRRQPPRGRAGFSLVEVTLALMVVAIGVLSVMSLFPVGLDQNVRSIADTHTALFAEDVLNGLQAWAEDGWSNLHEAIVPPAAEASWATNAMPFDMKNDDPWPAVWTNAYYLPDSSGSRQPLVHGEKQHLRFSFALTTNDHRTIKAATLFIWSGEFGSTGNPTIFYTEFFTNWLATGP